MGIVSQTGEHYLPTVIGMRVAVSNDLVIQPHVFCRPRIGIYALQSFEHRVRLQEITLLLHHRAPTAMIAFSSLRPLALA